MHACLNTCTHKHPHRGRECWFVITVFPGRLWLSRVSSSAFCTDDGGLRTSTWAFKTLPWELTVHQVCLLGQQCPLTTARTTVFYFVLVGPAITSVDSNGAA